jgi:hypothetical protein
MNLLELQVRIAMSRMPESGAGPTLLDWPLPALQLLSGDRLPFARPQAIQTQARRSETQS